MKALWNVDVRVHLLPTETVRTWIDGHLEQRYVGTGPVSVIKPDGGLAVIPEARIDYVESLPKS